MFQRRAEFKNVAELRTAVTSALKSYKVYSPPFRQSPNFLRNQKDENIYIAEYKKKSDANFTHFLKNKSARVDGLKSFIATFSEGATGTNMEIDEISIWFAKYHSVLLSGSDLSLEKRVFREFQEPWHGKYIGLNVVFDIGTYVGDSIINKSGKYWSFVLGSSSRGEANHTGYTIKGFKDEAMSFDPMNEVFRYAYNKGYGGPKPDTLHKIMLSYATM
ncbi:MAG: hypothetical protein ACLPIX_20370 [Rhodomicrobium sp.]